MEPEDIGAELRALEPNEDFAEILANKFHEGLIDEITTALMTDVWHKAQKEALTTNRLVEQVSQKLNVREFITDGIFTHAKQQNMTGNDAVVDLLRIAIGHLEIGFKFEQIEDKGFLLTKEEFRRLVPGDEQKVIDFIVPLNNVLKQHEITTNQRIAHFMAQVLHETQGLVHLEEIWGPTRAQKRYEGRLDLGNTHPGDGYLYRGRGGLHTTGRYNYNIMTGLTGVDILNYPELAIRPDVACSLSGWHWNIKELNEHADADDPIEVTRKINGGQNGIDDRIRRLKLAKNVLIG